MFSCTMSMVIVLNSHKNHNRLVLKLYFVNFGGYFDGKLAEFHDFTVVVAESVQAAKQLAKVQVINKTAGAEQLHKMTIAVDDCVCLDLIDSHYIRLYHDGKSQPLVPDWKGYQLP